MKLKYRILEWLRGRKKHKVINVYSDDSCRVDTKGGPYKVLIEKKKIKKVSQKT